MPLEKLTIYSFDTDDFSSIPVVLPVMYNPNTFSQNFSVNYTCDKAKGDQGEEKKYLNVNAEKLTFEFLFDATGASINSVQGAIGDVQGGVDLQIKEFLRLTYKVNGEKHEPRKLKLVWGTFLFNCVFVSSQITYKLFAESGRPLRATMNATFEASEIRLLQELKNRLFSSDLTRVREVKEGDTLPLIANEVYGDPKFYLELARVNQLSNFRKLSPGQKLVLPPINKT